MSYRQQLPILALPKNQLFFARAVAVSVRKAQHCRLSRIDERGRCGGVQGEDEYEYLGQLKEAGMGWVCE